MIRLIKEYIFTFLIGPPCQSFSKMNHAKVRTNFFPVHRGDNMVPREKMTYGEQDVQ